MYYKINDFKESWQRQSAQTRQIMDAMTDESLSQAVADGHRTLGRVAWHIVTSIPEMMNRAGLGISAVDEGAPVPATAAEISEAYGAAAGELLDRISGWDDQALAVEDDMYGEKWKRGLTLHVLGLHEIHHRGQMTVLMRQAGLKVPGVFGPAKEQWADYGMKEPEI